MQALSQQIAVNPHGPTVGAVREQILRERLTKYLPHRFHVSHGEVAGAGDTISAQTDVLIYNADHYPTFPIEPGGVMLVPESVYSVVSVKSSVVANLTEHLGEVAARSSVFASALGQPWTGLSCLFAYQLNGAVDGLTARFRESLQLPVHQRIAIVCVLGEVLLADAAKFGFDEAHAPAGVQIVDGALSVTGAGLFAFFFRLLLNHLTHMQLPPLSSLLLEPEGHIQVLTESAAPATTPEAVVIATGSAVIMQPGGTATAVVAIENRSDQPWLTATPSVATLRLSPDSSVDAAALLAVPGPAASSQPVEAVAPHQVVLFQVHLTAEGTAPGSHDLALELYIGETPTGVICRVFVTVTDATAQVTSA